MVTVGPGANSQVAASWLTGRADPAPRAPRPHRGDTTVRLRAPARTSRSCDHPARDGVRLPSESPHAAASGLSPRGVRSPRESRCGAGRSARTPVRRRAAADRLAGRARDSTSASSRRAAVPRGRGRRSRARARTAGGARALGPPASRTQSVGRAFHVEHPGVQHAPLRSQDQRVAPHDPAPPGGALERTHAGSVSAWGDRESAASASPRSPPDPEPARPSIRGRAVERQRDASGATKPADRSGRPRPADQADRPSRATTSPDAEEPSPHAGDRHAAPTGHGPHRLGIPAARADELSHVAAGRWRLPQHKRIPEGSRGRNTAANRSLPFLHVRTTSLRAAERRLLERTRGRSLSGPASRRLLPNRVASLSPPASPPRTARAPRPPSPRSARQRRRRRARPSARTGSSGRATPRRRTTAPPRSPPRPP